MEVFLISPWKGFIRLSFLSFFLDKIMSVHFSCWLSTRVFRSPSFIEDESPNQELFFSLFAADQKKTVCDMESSEGAQLQQTSFQFTRFVPLCDRYGGYRKVQCGSLGECWCVDRYGNELPRTKTRGIPYCGPDG